MRRAVGLGRSAFKIAATAAANDSEGRAGMQLVIITFVKREPVAIRAKHSCAMLLRENIVHGPTHNTGG